MKCITDALQQGKSGSPAYLSPSCCGGAGAGDADAPGGGASDVFRVEVAEVTAMTFDWDPGLGVAASMLDVDGEGA